MARLFVAVPVLSLLLAIAPAAPAPKAGLVYFPTRVGAQWVIGVGEEEVTYEVIAAEQKADGKLVSVGVKKGERVKPQKKVLASDEGVTEVEFGGTAIDPPDCLLKRPARPGDSWEREEVVGATS